MVERTKASLISCHKESFWTVNSGFLAGTKSAPGRGLAVLWPAPSLRQCGPAGPCYLAASINPSPEIWPRPDLLTLRSHDGGLCPPINRDVPEPLCVLSGSLAPSRRRSRTRSEISLCWLQLKYSSP
jgi:hypothetical protein